MQKIKPQNVVVFIHTDWCGYCKAMQNTTFKSKEIMAKLNNQFYFTMLTGEEKRAIIFAGKAFHYKPAGMNTGIHELAEALGTINGKINYPALVILNAKNEIVFQHSGYLNTQGFLKVLGKL